MKHIIGLQFKLANFHIFLLVPRVYCGVFKHYQYLIKHDQTIIKKCSDMFKLDVGVTLLRYVCLLMFENVLLVEVVLLRRDLRDGTLGNTLVRLKRVIIAF